MLMLNLNGLAARLASLRTYTLKMTWLPLTSCSESGWLETPGNRSAQATHPTTASRRGPASSANA